VGNRLDDLAVDVELELVARRVAEPDGTRTGVALEVREFRFVGVALTIDVVDDPELGARQTRGMQQPADEGLRVLLVTQPEQGARGERGVAQPAKAVIPVQVAADPLGQRSCDRRDD
jgi:hypothetical protein